MFRVYERENLNASSLFATYFKTKKEMVEYAKILKDPVFEKKVAYTWYPIEIQAK